MPSYFYHLKFELYPTPDPTTANTGGGQAKRKLPSADDVWLPSRHTDIFGNLPSHPPARRRQTPVAIRSSYHSSSSSSSSSPSAQPSVQNGSSVQKQAQSAEPVNEAPSPAYTSSSSATVIDCGPSRAPTQDTEGNIVRLTERQWRQRTKSFPPPPASAAIRPSTAVRDWRFGRLSIESFDLVEQERPGPHTRVPDGKRSAMATEGSSSSAAAHGVGPMFGGVGTATKAELLPLESKNTDIGWGVVHFYRDGDETVSLSAAATMPKTKATAAEGSAEEEAAKGEDYSTLCIPAVPSYLSPADFLGFVGEKWRDDVSHYRMVMTARMNRYLVLLKFRNGRKAQEWRKEFDGKVFNSMEAQVCHVVFVKSITFETPTRPDGSFPDLRHDPFTPSSSSVAATSSSLKPFPPPTPNLVELPTCPVCLERMDDTTGLMTIPCQHVFHCTCLQNWKGSGCPVCRHTNPEDHNDPHNTKPFGSDASNLCSVCDSSEDLWICLICGNVGCGRYKGGHAKEHWKDTAHSFALELETQHVWDYAGDMWVHRLIRDKGDGKVVELPAASSNRHHHHLRDGGSGGRGGPEEEDDVVPRAKLDNIGREYTHLLTSQLESQRVYFEEMLSKVADKASRAAAAAEEAARRAEEATARLAEVEADNARLRGEVVPQLERDAEREKNRAAKAQELARSLGKNLQEERQVGEGLMRRVEHEKAEAEALRKRNEELGREAEELREANRDLTMFISGQERLKELEEEGRVEAGEVEGGVIEVGEKGKGKGRRRGKK